MAAGKSGARADPNQYSTAFSPNYTTSLEYFFHITIPEESHTRIRQQHSTFPFGPPLPTGNLHPQG